MDSLLQDIRHGLRGLVTHPGFTAATVLTLALGIGANSAIFSVVNGVLLRALPYRDADRLVTLTGGDVDGTFGVSDLERVAYRDQPGIFERFGTYTSGSVNLTGAGNAERLAAAFMDADLLPLLGVSPLIGRNFTPEEDTRDRADVALLSHQLWQRRFAGSDAVLGQGLTIDGRAVTVIGVMPPDFRLPTDFTGVRNNIYFPLASPATPDPRNFHYMQAAGRLADGTTVEGARAQLALVSARLREEIGTLPPTFQARIVPIRDDVLGDVRPALLILLSAVGLVLLIASVNVANLLLARSEERMLEMSVRAALGAGRGRLLRQLFTESWILALIAGALGLGIASVALDVLVSLSPPNLPRVDEIGLDPRVLAFTAGVSLVAGLLFGAAPALGVGDAELQSALRAGGRGGTGGGRRHLRSLLVVGEMALAVMLAVGGGLLVRSFIALQAVDSGMDTERVLTMNLALPSARYGDKVAARAFYRDLLDRLRALPGVEAVGATRNLPMSSNTGDWGIRVEGREEERLPSGRRLWGDWFVVTTDYFTAMGIALADGRLFAAADDAEAPPVVLINEELARRYFPDGDPLGQRFRMSADIDEIYRTIVGVVGDVKQRGLDAETRPEFYLPHAQFPATQTFPVGAMTLVAKTAGDPLTLAAAFRGEARQLDPDVPVAGVRSMAQVVERSTSVRRLNVMLFGAFGLIGLLLVAVGVYGVMAYTVAQRTRELGVRMALGAGPAQVMRLVIGEGMVLSLAGVGIGIAGALALSRVLAGMLFGVGTHDPMTFVAIPIILTVVALAACYLPARRATRVDPMVALRAE